MKINKANPATLKITDMRFADIDGAPKRCTLLKLYKVLLRTEGIERNEVDIFSWVRHGDTISEIVDRGRLFLIRPCQFS